MFKFWLVSNGSDEESLADVSQPPDASIAGELSNYGVTTSLYNSAVWYNVAHSFGVYVDGKVFRQDLAKFQQGLNAYWNDTDAGFFVEFLIPEMYFKPDSYVTFNTVIQ